MSEYPAGSTVDGNGCADSQLDDDGDSVFNDVDQCPNTPVGSTVDGNGCADSQLDDDGDGVTNDIDVCPNTPVGDTANASVVARVSWTMTVTACSTTLTSARTRRRGFG